MKSVMNVAEFNNASCQGANPAVLEDIKNLFKKELQGKFGRVIPSNDVKKIFGADHGLPVIDEVVSIEAVSIKLVSMRELALSSAM
ncbi:MAG: hypothetical protein Q8N30_04035 [Methylococcales bacterium]|nr:hypothetical protein [Methylococcales bacterium]